MLTLALLLALAAPVARPGLALPPWALSPDGELVAAPPGVALVASGGSVEPVAPGLWRVVPSDGVAEVRLQAGAERATAPAEPPPGRVELAWEPATPVKGRDRGATLRLAVQAPDGTPALASPPPRLSASSGAFGPVERDGPGRFRVAFRFAETPFPEVVALVAVVPRCPACATPAALGVARLPLSAAIDLPGLSDPDVATTVEIGGVRWGPVKGDARGHFQIPVVVPPGAARAQALSVSARGNERHQTIDLGLPVVPRLACAVEPAVLPADGRARAAVLCTAFSLDGQPQSGVAVDLSVERGAVHGLRWDGDVLRGFYQAPRGGVGPVLLHARWGAAGQAGQAAARLELVAGPPATIDWKVTGEPLHPREVAAAQAVARDAFGSPVGPAEAVGPEAGRFRDGRFEARAEVGNGRQKVALRFSLPSAPAEAATTLWLRRDRGAWVAEARAVDGRPVRGVALDFSGGARASTDERGEARVPATGPAGWVKGPAGLRAAGWAFAPPPLQPVEVTRQVSVALRPAGGVDVSARLEGRYVVWRVRRSGSGARRAHPVMLHGLGVQLGPVEPAADPEVEGGRCAVEAGHGTVSVVDEESGATALVVVP